MSHKHLPVTDPGHPPSVILFLASPGYDVMLLPVVLGSAGTLKCLDRATKEMDIPTARKKKLYSKLHLHSIHSLQSLVSQRRLPRTAKTYPRLKRKDKRQMASLPIQPFHRGRPVNRPTPSPLAAFLFYS
jgi:hypothetical protein